MIRRLLILVLVAGCASSSHTAGRVVAPNVPGAYNPQVTQATIGATICTRGWTSTVRPPQAVTETIKRKMYTSQHLSGGLGAYELDHLVSLDLGGAPNDPANFWMQPIKPALVDDRGIEITLVKDVCAGRTTLDAARRAEVTWKQQHG